MLITAFEKYAILKERLGPCVRLDVNREGGWTVPGNMVSILTTEGPTVWLPRPTRDWTSAIEYAFHILGQCPVSTDLGETWYVFDGEAYLKSRGQKIPWVPYNVAREKDSEKSEPEVDSSVNKTVEKPVATEEPDGPPSV